MAVPICVPYFSFILSILCCVAGNPIQIPLLDKLEAPLVVSMDMNYVKRYIDALVSQKVAESVHTEMKSLKIQGNNWTDEIEGLKVLFPHYNTLSEKIQKLERNVSKFEDSSVPRQKCQSGTFGNHLLTNISPLTTRIQFDPPFSVPPAFVYGFYMLDASTHAGVRASAEVSALNKNGVDITLKTWASTTMYGLRVSWMACPQ